ncbi:MULTISPECIES: fimbrial protein [Burkholderia]|uniref:Fimbrial protein n=1 Tax=Burkholderia sola TaxID=2843302 RepID=A0ABV2CEW6_9BURK|nr:MULTISPECIES: fimbrial protein [unclassified Burkholderia]MBP0609665.1 type 1 fimbrial protein [Burkholderia sp. CpTa8-5]MBP0715170.1 type 1 fimbrial protein [Burkholderia sp. AcTa6-5]
MKFTPRRFAIHLLRLLIVWLMPVACGIGIAHAQYCKFDTPPNGIFWPYGFVKGGKLVIPPNLPNGAVIGTATQDISYKCDANPGGWEFRFAQYYYPTDIPGAFNTGGLTGSNTVHYLYVGIRTTNLDTGEVMMANTALTQPWGPPIGQTGATQGVLRIKKELIKLSDNIYNYPNAVLFNMTQYDSEIQAFNRSTNQLKGYWRSYWWDTGNIALTPVSCTVLTNNVNVPLPPVAASKLNAVGMTAGDRDFAISLSCKAGTNLYVTLTDLTDPGNMSNALTLTPDATAKGVKLRILRNGQPVSYGPDSSAVGNPNQWYVGSSGSVSSIPLSAQYIATGVVSGGKVKGAATFTLSYQ